MTDIREIPEAVLHIIGEVSAFTAVASRGRDWRDHEKHTVDRALAIALLDSEDPDVRRWTDAVLAAFAEAVLERVEALR